MRVIVVGGGAIGCAVALALARRGVAVELLELDRVGDGASGAAAGMLAPLSESQTPGPFVPIGLSALREFSPWVDTVEALAGMRVDLVHSGVLMLAAPGEEAALRDRLGWQRQHDPGATFLEGPALARLAPHLAAGPTAALHYPNEVQVDAQRYTRALRRAAQAAGAHVQEGIQVTAILHRAGRATGVATAGEQLEADAVVVASGSDGALLHPLGADLPLAPIKGEMVRLLPAGPLAGPIVFAPGGYLVPKADGSLLVGATQLPGRHDLGVAAGAVATLLAFAQRLVPELAVARFVDAWAGLRPGLPDRLPAIGPLPQLAALWVAVGHHRNGILLAGWTGERLAEAILDGAPLPEAVLPSRYLPAAAG